jgi:hypothetical protein
VALIPGVLASFADPRSGALPTLVSFQYNPTEVGRVFRPDEAGIAGGGQAPRGGVLSAAWPPPEEYTLKLELDATDGLERDGPISTTVGIAPRLAALEMLVQPVGTSLLGSLAGALLGRGSAAVPAGRLPLVLFIWGPTRIAPVRLTSLSISETSFDELLNPIRATADVGFRVLRPDDADAGDLVARAAAINYQGLRETSALLSVAQTAELRG